MANRFFVRNPVERKAFYTPPSHTFLWYITDKIDTFLEDVKRSLGDDITLSPDYPDLSDIADGPFKEEIVINGTASAESTFLSNLLQGMSYEFRMDLQGYADICKQFGIDRMRDRIIPDDRYFDFNDALFEYDSYAEMRLVLHFYQLNYLFRGNAKKGVIRETFEI